MQIAPGIPGRDKALFAPRVVANQKTDKNNYGLP
jgi:hypothetical protein